MKTMKHQKSKKKQPVKNQQKKQLKKLLSAVKIPHTLLIIMQRSLTL